LNLADIDENFSAGNILRLDANAGLGSYLKFKVKKVFGAKNQTFKN
jgi:hypothetical protein